MKGKIAMKGWMFSVALATLAGGAVVDGAAQLDAGIAVGTKAPVVSINDLDGKPVDLGLYIGKKPVMIEFWATWCELCKQLLPELDRVHKKFGDQISILGVNITVNESKERVRRYLEVHKPPYQPLYDDKGVGSRAYEVPATSFIVVIDQSGRVAYTGSGGEQDLVAAVSKAMAAKAGGAGRGAAAR